MHQTFSPDDYNKYIRTLCPHYDQFNQAIVNLAVTFLPNTIVSLGCGIGNLEIKLRKALPKTKIIGVDKDQNSLDYLSTQEPGIELVQSELSDYSFPPADMYLAGTSLHHLNGERKDVLRKIFERSRLFVNFEMFLGNGYDQIIQNNLEPEYPYEQWKEESEKVDFLRSMPEEMAEIQELGGVAKILLMHAPFALYHATTRT